MKKILSVVLALSMVLSMSVTAFAADDKTHDVSGEYTPTHQVIIEAENGSVTASPTTEKEGKYYAKEGATVTLTVTANDGYELNSLTVTDGSGSSVTVTEDAFTMPTSDVTVKATFKHTGTDPDPTPTTKTIYFDNSGKNWDSVYAYYWSIDDQQMVQWPGTLMTLVSGSIYSVEVPADATTIVFNDGIGSDQTADQTIPTDGKDLYDSSDDTWKTYSSTPDPDTTAKITGIEIVSGATLVDGVYHITPDSGDVTIKVLGENLDKGTENNSFQYLSASQCWVKPAFMDSISEDGKSASRSWSNSTFSSQTEKWEIVYTNDNWATQTGSGVFIIYSSTVPEPTKYTVTVDSTITHGTVTADPTSAAAGETVTLTVTPNGGYELEKLTVNDGEKDLEVTNTAGTNEWTFTMPAANVTVTATFKEQSKVGVTIEWGDMTFSYDDLNEKWDATGKGAYVKISTSDTNTADAISVSAKFTPADLMTEKSDSTDPITASWADGKSTATLNSSIESCTFTLNLSGKPKEAFSGKIGTVTLTVEETNVTVVNTLEELKTALANGGHIQLNSDISGGKESIESDKATVLDLNGKTLSVKTLKTKNDFEISGGNVKGSIHVLAGTLTVDNGTYAGYDASAANDTNLKEPIYLMGGNLIVNGNPTLQGSWVYEIAIKNVGTINLNGYTGEKLGLWAGGVNVPVSSFILSDGYGVYSGGTPAEKYASDYIIPASTVFYVKPTT